MVPLIFLVCNQQGSSDQAAALVYVSLLLPISQGRRAHRTKATELLNFDVVAARSF